MEHKKMSHVSVTNVKENCWKAVFFEKCKLREFYFFCETDPAGKSLEEVLEYPQVGKDKEITFKQALVNLGLNVPGKSRQQKKFLRRITDDASLEEHF